MTNSVIPKIDDSAGLREAAPMPEKMETGFTLSSRLFIPLPIERRGPIIAGGIIRFDLGPVEDR
jgi:hypothetical protein